MFQQIISKVKKATESSSLIEKLTSSLLFLLISINLVKAQDIQLSIQSGHSNIITAVDLSPDGRFIASASKDKRIIIWDRKTQKQFMTLIGHKGAVNDVLFSITGDTLYSVGTDKLCIQWAIPSGKIIKTFESDKRLFIIERNNVSGNIILAGENIGIYDVKLNLIESIGIKTFSRRNPSTLVDLKISTDGNLLAYTDGAGVANVIDFKNKRQVEVSRDFVNSIAFGEDLKVFT
ncbi:MAG: WD40 repeat domain-containing protein, partial [Sphingobacteriaceae bacterium]